MNYIDQLIENCNRAKLAKPTNQFTLNIDISEDAKNLTQNFLSLPRTGSFIDVITQTSGCFENSSLDFITYKKQKERSCARINSPSETMYVGSSTTGLKTRLEQHLGVGNRRVYALHLSHWFVGQVEIKIHQYDVSMPILQILEDSLHHKLKPAFGKQGGNNRN